MKVVIEYKQTEHNSFLKIDFWSSIKIRDLGFWHLLWQAEHFFKSQNPFTFSQVIMFSAGLALIK